MAFKLVFVAVSVVLVSSMALATNSRDFESKQADALLNRFRDQILPGEVSSALVYFNSL